MTSMKDICELASVTMRVKDWNVRLTMQCMVGTFEEMSDADNYSALETYLILERIKGKDGKRFSLRQIVDNAFTALMRSGYKESAWIALVPYASPEYVSPMALRNAVLDMIDDMETRLW